MKNIDLTGKRYGLLTVLKQDQDEFENKYWLCKCDCGNIYSTYTHVLEKNKKKHCGCIKYKELTGERFGKLTVLKNTNKRKRRYVIWKCKCDCGTEFETSSNNLLSGKTKSCGCLKKGNIIKMHSHNKKTKIDGIQVSSIQNYFLRKNNKTGTTGVSQSRNDKFNAQISIKGKKYNLGEYETIEKAIEARKNGEKKYHEPFLNKRENILKAIRIKQEKEIAQEEKRKKMERQIKELIEFEKRLQIHAKKIGKEINLPYDVIVD